MSLCLSKLTSFLSYFLLLPTNVRVIEWHGRCLVTSQGQHPTVLQMCFLGKNLLHCYLYPIFSSKVYVQVLLVTLFSAWWLKHSSDKQGLEATETKGSRKNIYLVPLNCSKYQATIIQFHLFHIPLVFFNMATGFLLQDKAHCSGFQAEGRHLTCKTLPVRHLHSQQQESRNSRFTGISCWKLFWSVLLTGAFTFLQMLYS